jgi:hypothetical protein
MKMITTLLILISFSAIAQIDTCPRHQSLTGLSQNFEITLTPKMDMQDEILVERGNSASFTSDVGKSSGKFLLRKGEGIKTSFVDESVNQKGDDKEKEEWVSTIGVMNINGKLERVGLYIDGQSVATIVELEEVIGEKFSISCIRKELAQSGSQEIKSSVSEQ